MRFPPEVLEQMNNSQSEESKDASLNNSSTSSQKRTVPSKSLNYVFKERFNFNLTSGFEEFSLKVYTSQVADKVE